MRYLARARHTKVDRHFKMGLNVAARRSINTQRRHKYAYDN